MSTFPPTSEPLSGVGNVSFFKRPLVVAAASSLATFVACAFAALLVYFFGFPHADGPPEGVDVSIECPAQVQAGEPFEVEVRIANLTDRERVLDSIDVYDGFLAGAFVRNSTPRSRQSSHYYDDFVTYDFQLEIPARGTTVVTFRAQALAEGDYMDDWAVCVDGPGSCLWRALRMIVSSAE